MKYLCNIMALKGFTHWFAPPLDIATDLRINALGVRELMQPCLVDRPAGFNAYLFMFFYDSVKIEDHDGKDFRAPETIMIWEPGKKHWYGHPELQWNHSWILCEGAFIRRVLKREKIPLNEALSLPDPALTEKALLEIHEELTGFAHPQPVIIRHLFENWICRMARMFSHRSQGQIIPQKMLETKRFIEMHFTGKLRLGDLAHRACLSTPHFCSEFKRYFKSPPLHYVIQLRLQWAAQELRNQNRTISEIADLAGFCDIFYFSRLFKQYFGVSPKAMRCRRLGPAKPDKELFN